MKFRVVACLLACLAALLLIGGLQYGRGQQAASSIDSDVDRLRALGYLDYAVEQAEDDRHGVVLLDRLRSYPGFDLYTTRNLCLAELINADGRVVQSWQLSRCKFWTHSELLPNGDLLVGGMDANQPKQRQAYCAARFLLRLTWSGELVWKRQLPVHHDAELTPNGHILALTLGFRQLPGGDPRIDLEDNSLALLSQEGELLHELSLYDLFSAARFQFQEVKAQKTLGQRSIDLFHANSVEWMRHRHLAGRHPIYALSNVLICLRHQDTIAVIDWDQERLVWTWGQGEISGPHNATLLANGNIMIFDNGLNRLWSRVIELDPITEEVVWQYHAANPKDFFTAARGGNQRLRNGNTLIANSDSGHAFEVTPSGELVWEFLNPHLDSDRHRATIIRMNRYETAFVNDLLTRKTAPAGTSLAEATP